MWHSSVTISVEWSLKPIQSLQLKLHISKHHRWIDSNREIMQVTYFFLTTYKFSFEFRQQKCRPLGSPVLLAILYLKLMCFCIEHTSRIYISLFLELILQVCLKKNTAKRKLVCILFKDVGIVCVIIHVTINQ